VASTDGVRAVGEARRHHPDLPLLDLRMPEVDGLTVLHRLAAEPVRPAVTVLRTFDADEFVARALSAGAVGFLLKAIEPERLVHAVRDAPRGTAGHHRPASTGGRRAAVRRSGGARRERSSG